MTKAAEEQKLFYRLVAGTVVFADKEGKPEGSINLNAIMRTDDINVTAADIGHCQQVLQQNMVMKTGAEFLQDHAIIDVFILSISPLGHMTEAEFTAGTQTQPVAESVN